MAAESDDVCVCVCVCVCLLRLTVCVSVAVPAEGQDPGGSPQGDATGEGAVARWPALPRAALQAAAGHCSPLHYLM